MFFFISSLLIFTHDLENHHHHKDARKKTQETFPASMAPPCLHHFDVNHDTHSSCQLGLLAQHTHSTFGTNHGHARIACGKKNP
jgi:hypothetical protein